MELKEMINSITVDSQSEIILRMSEEINSLKEQMAALKSKNFKIATNISNALVYIDFAMQAINDNEDFFSLDEKQLMYYREQAERRSNMSLYMLYDAQTCLMKPADDKTGSEER
jgi:hypothetical protein